MLIFMATIRIPITLLYWSTLFLNIMIIIILFTVLRSLLQCEY